MKLKRIIIIALLAMAGWYGYKTFFGGVPMGGPPGGAVPVGVAEVIQRDVTIWNEFSGRLVAVDNVEVRPRVSGNLEAILFQEGARVKKGDPLFTIDPRPFEADMQKAEAAATLAKVNYGRAKKLLAQRFLSQAEFDRSLNDYQIAQANVKTAKLNLEYAHITAPVSGRVGRAEITVGNYISSSPTPPVLTTIVSDSPIYADFDADEQTFLDYIGKAGIDASQVPVELGIGTEEGTPHQGKVKFFDNQISSGSGTIRVRAVFDNADGTLLPGLFARVRMGSSGKTSAVLITDKAIGTDQAKKFVWVVGDDNKATWREVKLGSEADGLRIISSGLQPGETIIIDGLQRIHAPGTPITPQMMDMETQKPEAGSPKPDEAPK